VVKEVFIRLVTASIILLCVISRGIAIPAYLQQLGYIHMDPSYNAYFNGASKAMLYISGGFGGLLILFFVAKAYFQRKKITASLTTRISDKTMKQLSEAKA
jgi:uncharacterized protein